MEHTTNHNLELRTSSASAEDWQAETAPQPATAGVQDEQPQPSTCIENASPPVFTRHQLRMISALDPSALGLPIQPDDEESDSASDDLKEDEEDIDAWERSQTWFRRRPSDEIEALFLRRGYIRLSDMYVELTDEEPPESPPSNELSKDPLDMMSRLTALLREYLVCSDAQLTILALWIVHTHCFIHSTITPYLDIYSAERQCGKTICLQLLHALCAEPWLATAPSALVLSQKVLGATHTVLVDDRHLSLASERQNVIGLLTNGCRRDLPYTVWRQSHLLELNAFSPKAFASLGRLQPSLADRPFPFAWNASGPPIPSSA